MADPEVKQQDEEQTDPQKKPNILDADKDGKISADELKTKLESADARQFTWKTGEGLKAYLDGKPEDKEAFKTMCEKLLTDPKNTSLETTKEKMKVAPTRAEVAKDTTLFTPQERGTIALTSLYLWLKGTPKAENYETVRNFLLNGVAKDAQGADLKLDQLVAPVKGGDEVVLRSENKEEKAEEEKKKDQEEAKTTPPKTPEKTEENVTEVDTTEPEDELDEDITDPKENTDTGGEDTEENTQTKDTKELSPKEQEALDAQSTKFIDQHKAVNTRLDKLSSPADITTKLYETSPLFGQHMRGFAQGLETDRQKAHQDIQAKHQANRATITPIISTVLQNDPSGKLTITTEKIKNPDGSLNEAGQVFREQLRAELTVLKDNAQKIAQNLVTDADTIAPKDSPERKELTQVIMRFEGLKSDVHMLLTNIGSGEKGTPGEQDFVKILENLNGKNTYAELFSSTLPEGSTNSTDGYTIKQKSDRLIGSIETNSSTFGLSNTLKTGKFEDMSGSIKTFKENTIPHEINGEIIYFNKEQLAQQGYLDANGTIKEESDQLLLDAKMANKIGARSVSELVKQAHQNKNIIFFTNEDGKDIRELGDDKQQKRLEQLAEKPDTEMSEKREEKTFAEQDLAGKLDKKASLSESRLILTDILKQPGLKRTALGMEKPEQSLLNKNDFLKLTIGDETRYISTNDYLDLTQDSRELSKREKNNIDDNQANEAEKTRINYSSLAEQKYNITAFPEDWKVDTQGSKLTFANKETKQIIGLDMKNTDAPIFSFRLDNKPFSLTTSPDKAKQVFDRIQDLNDKYTSLQEAYEDKDTKSTDQVFQLGFLQDHASDLISGNEMTLDATTRTGIKDLPTGEQTLTIDNFIYDDATSLLSYSATDQKKKEAAPPPPIPPQADNQSTYR